MTNYALLEINKYQNIEWGVNVVFQTTKLEIARAMKIVKEDAFLEHCKTNEDDWLKTPTVYQIIELDSQYVRNRH